MTDRRLSEAKRKCLRCGKLFPSRDCGNRICGKCTNNNLYFTSISRQETETMYGAKRQKRSPLKSE